MMKIGLVIPCFNEADRLPTNSYVDYLKEDDRLTLLFVNDGSRDATLTKLQALASHERIDFLDLKINQGKAEAVRQGLVKMEQLDLDYIGFWDADLATPLCEINDLRNFIKRHQNCDAVLCSRWLRLGFSIKRNPIRHYLGRVFATIASLILDLPVYDTQCGAKLFHKKTIAIITKGKFVSKWFFDIEILFRLKSAGYRSIWEYPISKWNDISGSKLKALDFLSVPLELFKIYRRYKNA